MKAETQGFGLLARILAGSRKRAEGLVAGKSALERRAASAPEPPSFSQALRGNHVALIAEVKRHSPSSGAIREGAHAGRLAGEYFEAGAAAVSVLTEPEHFHGSMDDLADVVALGRPALRKDFLVHELQLAESRAKGAAAVLLIVRVLEAHRLAELLRHAHGLGLEALVEVHNSRELDRALEAGARIIGVNARDLDSLEVNQELFEQLIPLIPDSVIAVAESGMRSRQDIERAASAGAHAALVGTALAGAERPGDVLRTMTRVPR